MRRRTKPEHTGGTASQERDKTPAQGKEDQTREASLKHMGGRRTRQERQYPSAREGGTDKRDTTPSAEDAGLDQKVYTPAHGTSCHT